jgi:hypothetical protein
MSYAEIKQLLDWLKSQEETVLLELLQLKSEDLVDAFIDKIIEDQDKFIRIYVENKQDNL